MENSTYAEKTNLENIVKAEKPQSFNYFTYYEFDI